MKRATVLLGFAAILMSGLWLFAAWGIARAAPAVLAVSLPQQRVAHSVAGKTAQMEEPVTISSTVGGYIKEEPTLGPLQTKVIIQWEGTPTHAELRARVGNTDPGFHHPIYLNGQLIGHTSGDMGCAATCECDDQAGCPEVYPFDPAFLVQGENTVAVTNEGNAKDTYKFFEATIYISGDITGTTRSYFPLEGSSSTRPDDTRIEGVVQVPIGYDPSVPTPLVIALPNSTPSTGVWTCYDFEAKEDGLKRYTIRANEIGWLLASLDLPSWYCSEATPFAAKSPSLAVQHDVINLVIYVASHYNVDRTRIYIAGFSAGGGMAATIAAKYPDVFAGVVDYAGPTDYGVWHAEHRNDYSWCKEFDGSAFDYQRRSSQKLARNLRYSAVRLVYGRYDQIVQFHHGQELYNLVKDYDRTSWITHTIPLNEPKKKNHVEWVTGTAECASPCDLQWLSQYTLTENVQNLSIISDEGKDYYWLRLAKAGVADDRWQGFAEVDASYDPATGVIRVTAHDNETPNRPLTLTLDLVKMGLNASTSYEVQDYDPATGDFELLTVSPVAGKLAVAVRSNRSGKVQRELLVRPATGSQLRQLTLQQGKEGYSGARDTYIVSPGISGDQDVPHGSATTLALGYDARRKALLQFDLNPLQDAVARGGAIKSAQLVVNLTQSKNPELQIDAYQLLCPWVDSEATWSRAAIGQAWAAPGAGGAADVQATAVYSVSHVSAMGAYTFNVRSLLQGWLAAPASNCGILLKGYATSSSTRYLLASAEYSVTGMRPALIMQYLEPPPAPTETPTPTHTNTPTPTATRTPTATSTATATHTATLMRTATPIGTSTATATATGSPTPTETASPTGTATSTPTAIRTLYAYLPIVFRPLSLLGAPHNRWAKVEGTP